MKLWGGLKKGRLAIGAGVLALAIGGGTLFAGRSHAAYTICRTDPTVQLSNGTTVTLWTMIQADISQVTGVYYVLHVPKGVTMTSVTYDSNGALEHLQIIADQQGTHFSDSTTVSTTTAGVPFSAYATRKDGTVASKNGKSGPTAVTLNWCT